MVIDSSILQAYGDALGEDADEFIRDIVDTFFANAEELFVTLANAIEAGGADEFVRAAHTLKSTSATVGAQRLSEMAKRWEMRGRSGEAPSAFAGELAALREAYTEAAAALKEIYM